MTSSWSWSVGFSPINYSPLDWISSSFLFQLPHILAQGGVCPVVLIVEAGPVAVVPFLKVMRGSQVGLHFPLVILHIRPWLHLHSCLIHSIFGPAKTLARHRAGNLSAIAGWLLLLHPVPGQKLSIMPWYSWFHIRHTTVWYLHVMSG